MKSESRGPKSGWTVLKVIGVVIGVQSMIGFGLCSFLGFFMAAEYKGGDDGLILFLAVIGAGLAFLCGRGVVAIIRRARRDGERHR